MTVCDATSHTWISLNVTDTAGVSLWALEKPGPTRLSNN